MVGPRIRKVPLRILGFFPGTAWEKQTEPADKPGFVVDSHSSRRIVTDTLKQPTRRHRGSRHRLPIWSCSRWGLPCRSVAGLAVRSYRTISPLPACLRKHRRYLSVALSVGSRRPGVTWHRTLWSPDFPRHRHSGECDDATAWPTPSRALSHGNRSCIPGRMPAIACDTAKNRRLSSSNASGWVRLAAPLVAMFDQRRGDNDRRFRRPPSGHSPG